MTIIRIQEVAQFYYDILRSRKVDPVFATGKPSCHICYVVDTIRNGILNGKPIDKDKMNRWLKFVQGWFWTQRFFTIDELRAHNDPAVPAPKYNKAKEA